jgi:CHAD domain-containing protein
MNDTLQPAAAGTMDETPSQVVLAKILGQRLKAARKHVRSMLKRSNVDVHQMRVDLRRASSCLQFFSPFLNAKQSKSVRRTLRDCRRSLGMLRDTEVFIKRSLGWTTLVPAEELSEFIVDLARSTKSRQTNSSPHFPKSKTKNAEKIISKALRLVAKNVNAKNDSWRDLIRYQLEEDLVALQHPLQSDPPDKDALHQFRICCKHARYQLEIIDQADISDVNSLIQGFKKAQEDLGHIHDTFVILERLHHLKKDRCKLSKASIKSIIASETASLEGNVRAFSSWWQSERILEQLNDWLAG